MSDYFANLSYAEKLLTEADEKIKIEIKLCLSQDKEFKYLMITYTSPAKLWKRSYRQNWGFPIDLRQSSQALKIEVEKTLRFLREKHNKLLAEYGEIVFTLFEPKEAILYEEKILERVRSRDKKGNIENLAI